MVEVVEWVGEHLDIADASPGDAPSALAWSQLQWARENRKEFMSLWKTTCATAPRVAAERESDDGEELFKLLDKLAEIKRASKELAKARR